VDIVRVVLYANKSVWHLIMHNVVTFKFYAVATKIMRFLGIFEPHNQQSGNQNVNACNQKPNISFDIIPGNENGKFILLSVHLV
jgi:hypothetical protein